MDVNTLLLQQWTTCLDKEDWFPPLEKVLEDITFEQAIWKPIDAMNSIWELVSHLLFYEKRLLMRFLGETANEPQAEIINLHFDYQLRHFKIGRKQKKNTFMFTVNLKKY